MARHLLDDGGERRRQIGNQRSEPLACTAVGRLVFDAGGKLCHSARPDNGTSALDPVSHSSCLVAYRELIEDGAVKGATVEARDGLIVEWDLGGRCEFDVRQPGAQPRGEQGDGGRLDREVVHPDLATAHRQ